VRTDLTPKPPLRVHPMRYRCDRCQHSVEVSTTTPRTLPDGWSSHQVTGDNYSSWDEDWCPTCTGKFNEELARGRRRGK
jgi:hypothetical protein